MSIDDAKRRYAEYIKLQLFDDKFLSRERERKILAEGVTRFEIPLEEARAIVLTVAGEQDFIFEKDVDKLIKEIMSVFATGDGQIGVNEFNHAVLIYKKLSAGYVTDSEARIRIKQIMLENNWKPRRQSLVLLSRLGSRKWFKEISEK